MTDLRAEMKLRSYAELLDENAALRAALERLVSAIDGGNPQEVRNALATAEAVLSAPAEGE